MFSARFSKKQTFWPLGSVYLNFISSAETILRERERRRRREERYYARLLLERVIFKFIIIGEKGRIVIIKGE